MPLKILMQKKHAPDSVPETDVCVHIAPRAFHPIKRLRRSRIGIATLLRRSDSYIIGTAAPLYLGGFLGEAKKLRSCYTRALTLAQQHAFQSITFLPILHRPFSFPPEKATEIAVSAINDWLVKHDSNIDVYLLVTVRPTEHKSFSRLRTFLDKHYLPVEDAILDFTDLPTDSMLPAASKHPFDSFQESSSDLLFDESDLPDALEIDLDEKEDFFCDLSDEWDDSADSTGSFLPVDRLSQDTQSDESFSDDDSWDADFGGSGAFSDTSLFSDSEASSAPNTDSSIFSPFDSGDLIKCAASDTNITPLEFCDDFIDDPPPPAPRKRKNVFSVSSKTTPRNMRPLPPRKLEDLLGQVSESFSQMLFRLIDQHGMTDPEVYKRANIDRRLFSKIRSNPNYQPSKETVLSLAIALELNLDQTTDLLRRAGFAFSPCSKSDLIVEFFIQEQQFNIHKINEALYSFNQKPLSA